MLSRDCSLQTKMAAIYKSSKILGLSNREGKWRKVTNLPFHLHQTSGMFLLLTVSMTFSQSAINLCVNL